MRSQSIENRINGGNFGLFLMAVILQNGRQIKFPHILITASHRIIIFESKYKLKKHFARESDGMTRYIALLKSFSLMHILDLVLCVLVIEIVCNFHLLFLVLIDTFYKYAVVYIFIEIIKIKKSTY